MYFHNFTHAQYTDPSHTKKNQKWKYSLSQLEMILWREMNKDQAPGNLRFGNMHAVKNQISA